MGDFGMVKNGGLSAVWPRDSNILYLFLWESMTFECRNEFIDHAIEAADHDVGND